MALNRQLYLTGKIRVYETHLFGRGAFTRFTEHKNPAGFIRELKDTGYGKYMEEDGLEAASFRYIDSIYRDFRKDMGRDAVMLDAFMVPVRAAEYMESVKNLEAETGERRVIPVSSGEGEAVKRAVRQLEISGDLSDRQIEKAFIDSVSHLYLDKFSSPAIKELWRSHIDIKNFLNNIRHIKPGPYFEGGKIPVSFWDNTDCRREIPAKLGARPFMKAVSRDEPAENYERKIEEWTGARLKELRKITFGPEPVCAFFLTLLREAKNLTAVYAGLKIGLNSREIMDNLFYSYA